MSERNLHAKAFDEGTQEKLNIYREYLREWLPVFLHAKMRMSRIQIFDFFAGPGVDVEGKAASPVIALEEIHSAVQKAREHGNNPPAIDLYLNEFSLKKFETLTGNIKSHPFVGDVNVTFARYDFPLSDGPRIQTLSPASIKSRVLSVSVTPSGLYSLSAELTHLEIS